MTRSKKMRFCLFIVAALIPISQALSQESEQTQVNYSVDTAFAEDSQRLRKRNTLTGDWGGLRTSLKDKGFIFKGSFTNFYQGMVSGEGSNDFEFGSKFGFTTILNGEKIGLWKEFFATWGIRSTTAMALYCRSIRLWPTRVLKAPIAGT